jgi:hypothetical protein
MDVKCHNERPQTLTMGMINFELKPGQHPAVPPEESTKITYHGVSWTQQGTHEGLHPQELGPGFIPGLWNVAAEVTKVGNFARIHSAALRVGPEVKRIGSDSIGGQHGPSLDRRGIGGSDAE